MFSIQPVLTLFLTMAMALSLTACGAEAAVRPAPETPKPPAPVRETPESAPDPPAESSDSELEVTEGTKTYRDFRMDNVLHAPEGDIHYHIHIPDDYDGSEAYALFLTLPGYEGLYFQGMGQNLYSELFAFEALKENKHMIVAAPQLSDWGETSAVQAIALTEYLLAHYNIDQERVYAEGYSGGGEGDEYYGSEPSREAYNQLHDLYTEAGLTENEIGQLLVLDIKDADYFREGGAPVSTAAEICLPGIPRSWGGCSLKDKKRPEPAATARTWASAPLYP